MNWGRKLVRIAAVCGLLAVLMVGAAAPAAAHVDLVRSSPSEREQLISVPDVMELVFSATVVPAGDGIQLLDDAGYALDATVSQPSGERFLVSPNDPLPAGTYGLVWTVRAGDAHPRTGAVVFTVAPTLDRTTVAGSADALTQEAAPATPEPNFLTSTTAFAPGEWLARIGRWVALTGVLVAIGTLAFAALVLTGDRREVYEATYWVRRAGVAVVAGAILEAAGTSAVLEGSFLRGLSPPGLLSTLGSALGVAVLLRVAGGFAMLFGAQTIARPLMTPEAELPEPAAGRDARPGTVATLAPSQAISPVHRLDVARSGAALGGVGAATISYLFDGHTVTTSPAMLVRLADLVHVIAAGVWVGGVLMMGWVLARRWRRGRPLGAAELAIRFSPVAAVALSAVGVAGLALTWMILESPGELVSTDWGRVLIAKLIVVGLAAAMGGYNHRNVVPRLAADCDDEEAGDMLRRVVRIEGAVLVAVVAATAFLVGAAS